MAAIEHSGSLRLKTLDAGIHDETVRILLADCAGLDAHLSWEIVGKDAGLSDTMEFRALSQLLCTESISLIFASFDPHELASSVALEKTCFIASELDIPVCSISITKEPWVAAMARYMGAMRHFEDTPTRAELLRLVVTSTDH